MNKIPFLQDKPISSPDNDKFGHEHYSDLLFDLISGEQYKTPYNIGLLGKWGVGKSSIKEMCQERLKKEKSENVFCIDFNAWKYGGDGVKKALLKEIFIKLGGKDDDIRDWFSRHITRQVLELTKNNELWKNWRNVLSNYGQIFITLGLVFFAYKYGIPMLGDFGQSFASVSFAVLAGFVIEGILRKNNMLVPLFQNITKMDMPQATPEVYEEFLVKQVEIFKNTDKYKKITKIAVFVDDIDRLPSASEMIEGINAIRAFMDMRKLPPDIGFVFVISCCEYKISEALYTLNIDGKRYDDNPVCEIDHKVESKRFLDKIFYFRIDIPPFAYRDMIDYTSKILKSQIENFGEFEKTLENCGTDIENLLCRLIHPKVQEPRQALQIMNTFFLSWNIANQREQNNSGGLAGGLANGIITKHPLTLAILSVLKVDFPYFYKELLKEPKLLSYALGIIRSGKKPKFFIDEKIENDFISTDINGNHTLKSQYYNLVLYLSLINDRFEMPKSIKPFLLLNQDPLSRKLGEGAFEIEEALISKKIYKVEQLLNLKKEKLSKESAQLLLDVYENCPPYPLHKENVFYSLVQLTRHTTDDTRFLIDSFADTLENNSKYRDMLKVDDYEKILFAISSSKANKILSIITVEFMQDYRYTPEETDEEKSAQDAIFERRIAATNLKLKYYSQNENKVDQAFFEWVANPKIGTFSDDSTELGDDNILPFKYTYDYMKDYPFLTKHIARHYLQSALRFLKHCEDNELDANKDIGKEALNKSLNNVLTHLLEHKTNEFEGIVGEFIESDNEDAFDFIFSFIKDSQNKFTDKTLDFCVDYLLWLMVNELKVPSKTVEIQEVLGFLQPIIKEKYEVLGEESLKCLEELVSLVCRDTTHYGFTIWAHNLLKEKKYKNIEAIEEIIIQEVFNADSLGNINQIELKKCLLEKCPGFSKISFEKFIQGMQKLVLVNDEPYLEEVEAESLSIFNERLIERAVEDEIDLFLEAVLGHISGYVIDNNYNQYLGQLFDVKKLFKYSKNTRIAETLCALCQDADFEEQCLGEMDNLWQDLNQEIWDKNTFAQEIFNTIATNSNSIEALENLVKIYLAINNLKTTENLSTLYNKIHELRNEIEKVAILLVQLDAKKYTVEEIASFGLGIDETEESKSSLYDIWKHLIDQYTKEEKGQIADTILFSIDSDYRFKIWINLLKEKTDKYEELAQIIENSCEASSIDKLLLKRMLITDLLQGEDRKEPSRILLLNSKTIFDSDLPNKLDLTTNMLKWSYDLYNDIIKDTPLHSLSDEHKKLIQDIFLGKTFGRIKFRNNPPQE